MESWILTIIRFNSLALVFSKIVNQSLIYSTFVLFISFALVSPISSHPFPTITLSWNLAKWTSTVCYFYIVSDCKNWMMMPILSCSWKSINIDERSLSYKKTRIVFPVSETGNMDAGVFLQRIVQNCMNLSEIIRKHEFDWLQSAESEYWKQYSAEQIVCSN
jgi:hypothetical protein